MKSTQRKFARDQILGGTLVVAALAWSALPFVVVAVPAHAPVEVATAAAHQDDVIQLESVVVVGHRAVATSAVAANDTTGVTTN